MATQVTFDDLIPDMSRARDVTPVKPGVFQDAQGNTFQAATDAGDGYFRDSSGAMFRDTSRARVAPQAPQPIAAQVTFDDLVPQPQLHSPPQDFREHGLSGAVDATVRTLARGVPVLGQAADEGNAAIAATLSPYVEPILNAFPGHDKSHDVGGGATWQDRFSRAVAMQRGMDAQLDEDHPNLSAAGQITGGVLGTLAGARYLSPATGLLAKAAPEAGMLPTMAANAVDAGAIGAGMGYANGTGGWTDPSRIEGAGMGGAFGAAGGAAVAPALLAGRGLWNATGRKALDAVRGRAPVFEPSELGAGSYPSLRSGRGVGGPPSGGAPQLTSATDRLADVLATISTAPKITAPPSAISGAYNRIAKALQRAKATPADARAKVESLGTFGMLADANVPMQDLARTTADAAGEGGQIAAAALNLRQSGIREGGSYKIRPASGRIGDSLAEGMGVAGSEYNAETGALLAAQKRAAGPAYSKAYAAAPVDAAELSSFQASPNFQGAYDRARKLSQTEFVMRPDGTEAIIPLPAAMPNQLDWRTLDLMKQGLDDLIREGKVQGIGANEQGALKGYLGRFVTKLDALNPDYGAARSAFAGPARSMDALDAGRAYMGEDAPVVASAMAEYSPAEQRMYRVGALQAERDRLGAVPDTYDAATRAGVNTPNRLARLQQLFPDARSFAQYADLLQANKDMFATRGRVLGGSLTSRNLAQAEDAAHDPAEAVARVAEALHNPGGSAVKIIGKALTFGNGQKLDEHTANALAAILFNMDKRALPAFEKNLTDAERRVAMARALARTRGAAGAFAGTGADGAFGQRQ